jgi:hypothetical protein
MIIAPAASPAVLLIGPMDGKEGAVESFYRGCQFETSMAGWVPIDNAAAPLRYSTFERLLQLLTTQPQEQVIIVNHGSVKTVDANPLSAPAGLICPFTSGNSFSATGGIIGQLGQLAPKAATLTDADWAVKQLAGDMGVTPTKALAFVKLVAEVRKQRRIIHIRGCNIGLNEDLCVQYRDAFNALGLTAPKGFMFFSRVLPIRTARAKMLAERASKPAQLPGSKPMDPQKRRRVFPWPGDADKMLILDVEIKAVGNGHKFPTDAYMDNPAEAALFANLLVSRWAGSPPTQFFVQGIWPEGEISYFVPQDIGYRRHLWPFKS